MSKKSKVINSLPNISWGYGYVVGTDISDRIVGNIFGIIELAGLTQKQEESAKDLIRKAVWKQFEDAIFITEERHNEIRDLYYKKKKEIGNDYPMSAI